MIIRIKSITHLLLLSIGTSLLSACVKECDINQMEAFTEMNLSGRIEFEKNDQSWDLHGDGYIAFMYQVNPDSMKSLLEEVRPELWIYSDTVYFPNYSSNFYEVVYPDRRGYYIYKTDSLQRKFEGAVLDTINNKFVFYWGYF